MTERQRFSIIDGSIESESVDEVVIRVPTFEPMYEEKMVTRLGIDGPEEKTIKVLVGFRRLDEE